MRYNAGNLARKADNSKRLTVPGNLLVSGTRGKSFAELMLSIDPWQRSKITWCHVTSSTNALVPPPDRGQLLFYFAVDGIL